MRLALLTTDSREHDRTYNETVPHFGTAPAALLQGFAAMPKVEVHVISCTQKPMSSPEKLQSNIWFHNLHVPKVGWLRTGYQGCVRSVRGILRELRPDIVHGQGTERDCAISAVLSGFPNVITIHGNMRLIAKLSRSKPFSYLWLSARLERFTIPRSGGVVCISRHTKEAVQGLAKKTWLVPNAADQAFFNLKNAPHPQPVILCVGNIIPLKNQNAFIRALDPVAERMQFKVVFVGGALSSDRYAREFGQLIITRPWCQHIGFADREILRNWLVKARLLALPSLEENCPMVLLEAMAAGLPVVAARVGGVPDIFEENVEGILFDPTNPESIRTAVVRTLEDPARAGTMAESAKNKALERYRPAIIAARHIDVYKDVLISAN